MHGVVFVLRQKICLKTDHQIWFTCIFQKNKVYLYWFQTFFWTFFWKKIRKFWSKIMSKLEGYHEYNNYITFIGYNVYDLRFFWWYFFKKCYFMICISERSTTFTCIFSQNTIKASNLIVFFFFSKKTQKNHVKFTTWNCIYSIYCENVITRSIFENFFCNFW